MRRLMTQASSAPSTTNRRADRQHRVPEACAGRERDRLPASRPRAPRACRRPPTSVPSHVEPSDPRYATTSPSAARRRRLDALARSVQTPVSREPRRSALPTPISRATARPAVGRGGAAPEDEEAARGGGRRRGGLHLGDVLGVEQVAVRQQRLGCRRARRSERWRPAGRPGRRAGAAQRPWASRSPDGAPQLDAQMFCGAVAQQRRGCSLRRRDRRRIGGDEPPLQGRLGRGAPRLVDALGHPLRQEPAPLARVGLQAAARGVEHGLGAPRGTTPCRRRRRSRPGTAR